MTVRDWSTSTIMGAARQTLIDGGFREVTQGRRWSTPNGAVFEDPYTIVAVVVFETWHDLTANWKSDQGEFVDLISNGVAPGSAKFWDGSLVLITPAFLPHGAEPELSQIRYDTSHVRKIVGTGDVLPTLDDVKGVVQPLLPLPLIGTVATLDDPILDRLPILLEARGIERLVGDRLVTAFRRNEPLLEALHASRDSER